MRSGRNYDQRQSETLESSFELEEPEDFEQDSEVEQVNSAASKRKPAAREERDRERQESGEQTDTLSTHSSSSTPTTADVADVETISSLPLSPPAFGGRGSQLVKRHSPLKDQQQADSSSSSSSSQQPDLDDVPTVSGCDQGHNSLSNAATSSSSSSTTPQTSRYAAAAAHPSAAFAETAVVSTSGSSRACGGSAGAAHRRTHSAASYISMRSQGANSDAPPERPKRNRFFEWLRVVCNFCCCKSSGIGEPSVHHALVVIFLEFFAWGLLTMPIISTLNQTFPDHTFLMNGLVMGIKGILSFLSAPLIGALSDIWGRKFFLLVTVFFTCLPIPLMSINTWWFFAMISISGAFAVTFSVVFAYVADVTTPEERSKAYGLASATFAASLVISPALGNALMEMYGDTLVVALSTAIALLDVFFILVAVPESLSEKMRPASWGAPISWEQADPFLALRKVGTDKTVLMLCLTVLLSYLPEAGEYSCMFVYLKLKMGFNYVEVSVFIAIVGILSITVQVTLGSFMQVFGAKRTIIMGLALEIVQLLWYGFGSQKWMMWSAGVVAALGSITYPAISAFVSLYAAPESQGAVQGMITGMRGLCNGLGPAVFGVVFYLFNVDLNDDHDSHAKSSGSRATNVEKISQHVPGPPFVFGALCVFCAIIVAAFIPEGQTSTLEKKRASLDVQYEIETGHKAPSSLAPLIRSDSLAQL
ncbi:hippocampus abundant transcript 1 protein isoform X1 [Drosophila eugracilis]|uniref:hippocampus abundant transcript 1 protein isoform X1 n=1 Tax=Drosophila eugracilis TaxID=29029 RepID=UPI0007E86F20|nr:hippocampus abundant transcript 1 protein isoform X1 [Drosophila eugracilis]